MTTQGGKALASNWGVLLLALVAVVGAAVGGMAMAGSGPPSADAILKDTSEEYANAETIVGSARISVDNGSASRTVDVSFAATDDNKSRMSVTAANRTVVLGSNGSVGWLHDEATGLTRVYDLPEYDGNATPNHSDLTNRTGWNEVHDEWIESREGNRSPHDWNESTLKALAWDWTPENTTATRVGTGTIQGVESHVIEIEPDDDSRNGTLTLWIGTDVATVHQARLAGPNGSVTVTFTEIRFDVDVADSTFQPPGVAPPSGTTVVDSFEELQAATAFDLPRLGNSSYAFESGSTLVYGNATAAIQGYTGPANVSLVMASGDLPIDGAGAADEAEATPVSLAGVNATVAETERGVVVSWTAGGLRHAIVSDGSREATLALAQSVIAGNDNSA